MNKNAIAVSQEILNIFDKWTPETFLRRYRLLYDGVFKPAVNMIFSLVIFLQPYFKS